MLPAVTPVAPGGWLRWWSPGIRGVAPGRHAGRAGRVVAVVVARHPGRCSRPSRRSRRAGGCGGACHAPGVVL
ncbi:hypothetical protein BJ964_003611 [Actinoplanes lobatus]|uniref:Uncharacterized protein n=1 Tax=Actinoplanes lobatus TaxID=113568 RepID=A0A7W7HF97_9ACTN|nr:hypothetical protein [Actinoplanes lobatus]